ncbi:hypothetical protein E2542_SST26534 [Spatholobus suberectus]|nr:hypothetical protein E2542_SST26534 [Spatholobus suberectus]
MINGPFTKLKKKGTDPYDFCFWSHIKLGQRAHWKSLCTSFPVKSGHCLFPPFTLRLDPSSITIPLPISDSKPDRGNVDHADEVVVSRISRRTPPEESPTFRSRCRFDASHALRARNEPFVPVPSAQDRMQLPKRVAGSRMVVKT